ncbi:phosphonate ABC transporter ATP-binding protein [Indiicoccus explosivorum]|uniref:phosphonate ABC transporter ATP-binding protein n=1 Tax=Indiicoccus explosivorum TaxID=1917864 RepID=UPI000B441CCA|nr:phosphonate ABC transporter ATP-binding protein [Indiicoccus explosivorum]
MLKMNNVTVRYPGTEQAALSDLTVTLNTGEFVCVLGKSGAGKSTFIRCINGLQRPESGEVILGERQVTGAGDEELRKIRREVGMIFQHFNLIPRLSVRQNVLTGMFGYRPSVKNLLGLFSDEEKERADRVLRNVGLEEMASRRVENLSGGQKQRVGIARALVQNPSVLLGDEPVASLDPGTADYVFRLLQEMHERMDLLTIINVHDVDLAKRYATRILALKEGKLIFDGNPLDFDGGMFEETYGSRQVSAPGME